ncbi:MAG: Spy/CpxP family protein refolding chaperone [Verrucomicrobiae bacterium]|nr:Spy/CpxP family protein refolding chaperone [Verrucomicrobiae bacterium]
MKQSVLKTVAWVVALCVAAPVFATAGEKAAGGKRGEGRVGAMDAKLDETLAKLNLTEEQKTKIEACKAKFREFMKEHAADMKAAREGTDEQKKREVRKTLMEKLKERRDGIRAVLTDEQKKKFDEEMPAWGARGERGKPRGKRGGSVVR